MSKGDFQSLKEMILSELSHKEMTVPFYVTESTVGDNGG